MTGTATAILKSANATVFVSNLDRAVHFYTETLGFKMLYRVEDHFAMIELNGFKIGLHPPGTNTPAPVANESIQIGLDVTVPIEQAVKDLTARGVTFDQCDGSTIVDDDGAVKLAFFKDPDGHVLYLCEPK